MTSFDVESYLSEKFPRVRRDGREAHVHCPFHGEDQGKRGRLYVNVDPSSDHYGLWDCKVCGESGNLNQLRRYFGDPPVGDKEGSDYEPSDAVAEILDIAADYYARKLGDNPDMLGWLKERGLSIDSIEKFKIGYADGSLRAHLLGRGYKTHEIIASGLMTDRGTDFFLNAVTIPYFRGGRCVQVRGRFFEGSAKYKTPAGAGVFLFNSDTTYRADNLIVCEGEFDAIVAEQNGFFAVGIPGVTSWKSKMKEWEIYFDMPTKVTVVFDGDQAGRKAADELVEHLGPKATAVDLGDDLDLTDWFLSGNDAEDLQKLLTETGSGFLLTPGYAFEAWDLEQSDQGLQLPFGFPDIDGAMQKGMLPGQVQIVIAKTGAGKEQPVSALLPTPSGFKKMGDISVGDQMFGKDGSPTTVTGVFPQGVKPIYRVHFRDHTYLDVGLDHLWTVGYRSGGRREWKYVTMSTQEIMDAGLRCGDENREYKFIIPMCEPVQYPERDLPVEPYTLGALIADGCMTGTQVMLSCHSDNQAIVNQIARYYECKIKSVSAGWEHLCPQYAIQRYAVRFDPLGRISRGDGLINCIKELGLDVKSCDKFIPDSYLMGSVDQRIALLQGLMDGDGSQRVDRRAVRYHTTSERLAENVVELVNSLGGTATVRWDERQGRRSCATLSIMLPSGIQGFSVGIKDQPGLPRKSTVPRRSIVAIEYVRDEEAQCIMVDAEDHLYVAERSYVVTHNTAYILSAFEHISRAEPEAKFLLYSLEQTASEWADRAWKVRRFFERTQDPEVARRETMEYWSPRLRLSERNRISIDEFRQGLELYAAEMGQMPDLVAVDYLGYFARSFRGEAYERTTAAVMALKQIAKEYKVRIMAPHQVSRGNKAGQRPSMDDARDSGAVEETADFLFSYYRPDMLESGAGLMESKGLVNIFIAKSRHGGAGQEANCLFAPMSTAIVPSNPRNMSKFEKFAAVEVEQNKQKMKYEDAFQQALGNERFSPGSAVEPRRLPAVDDEEQPF